MDTVNFDGERLGESDVTHELSLFDCRHGIESRLIVDTIATEGIDREIGDAERGEVLEEVCALRRVDLE